MSARGRKESAKGRGSEETKSIGDLPLSTLEKWGDPNGNVAVREVVEVICLPKTENGFAPKGEQMSNGRIGNGWGDATNAVSRKFPAG
jgi:hypothetical protein